MTHIATDKIKRDTQPSAGFLVLPSFCSETTASGTVAQIFNFHANGYRGWGPCPSYKGELGEDAPVIVDRKQERGFGSSLSFPLVFCRHSIGAHGMMPPILMACLPLWKSSDTVLKDTSWGIQQSSRSFQPPSRQQWRLTITGQSSQGRQEKDHNERGLLSSGEGQLATNLIHHRDTSYPRQHYKTVTLKTAIKQLQ